ncbi:UNVERIFIED_ORG: oxygen-independent coproporphyrinogen-3 oxidase [Idiomarina abyssalis]|uniref:oxygen-independent coproporphyrinogen III oxidase n=1 Tax=Idiomarina sp. 017G TaxID=2183988 RepID=UPI000E0FB896|nr:oxygen-independent coproporphyrinogen III oxidase [Idiomarina sp. 017G]TDO48096.1 oxygen-independent coproporphyrinogen-3 oxidase [Idiomarina sp. 017G]
MSTVTWDKELIEKYNINGPRYTSYPTALMLSEQFSESRIETALKNANDGLCLYLHLPFCHKLCYYCGCNKVITRHQNKADRYLDYLAREMAMYQPMVKDKKIRQIHLGGGTPTFLTEQQLTRLMELVHQHFTFADNPEVSIEIDPRSCSDEKLRHLRDLGFNRVSYGVQDFDKKVQIAINRVQDIELIAHQLKLSKELGFESINLDLIYGLPYQRPETFKKSIEQVIEMDPDRISVFSYAHLPQRFAGQKKIPEESIPQPSVKLSLLEQAITQLNDAGYQFIGMDHFAKKDDGLAIAQREGRLQRNFQGYTTDGQDALLGLGVSSISQVNGVLWQHEKELPAYYKMIDNEQKPIIKSMALNDEDKLRAALISQVICHFELDIEAFKAQWDLDDFWAHFAEAIPLLKPFIEDGLVDVSDKKLRVTDLGRLWVRSICACFDEYLDHGQNRYSKVV